MEHRLNETDELLRAQGAKYPRLEAQDLVKALYQAEFGCGHLIADPARGLQWLREEAASVSPGGDAATLIEPLGSRFCRVHLAALSASGLTVETLFRLFELSAREPAGDASSFAARLNRLEAMAAAGKLGIDGQETARYLEAYRRDGCPAVHHSDAFRQAYSPAYRVVSARYVPLLPLLCAIDRMTGAKRLLVAVEGGSAAGKTTLAAMLGEIYDANVFHMDDFFLQPHQRTPERYAEPGGNVDRERFSNEVLGPLLRGEERFSYRRFDCSRMALGERVYVRRRHLNIVEGAYSLHPALADAYDLSVFLDISPEEQATRILCRNGLETQRRFLNEWIPLEKRYFEATHARERCGLVLSL